MERYKDIFLPLLLYPPITKTKMCWQFYGIVDRKSKATDKLLYVPNYDWTVHKCPGPGHTKATAPSARDLPLEFQWQIATWAAERIKRWDLEYSDKFQRIVEQKVHIGYDQSIFDKYSLRVRVSRQEEDESSSSSGFEK